MATASVMVASCGLCGSPVLAGRHRQVAELGRRSRRLLSSSSNSSSSSGHMHRRRLHTSAAMTTSSTPRVSDMTRQFKDMRKQMEENEDVATLMRGLRGQGLSDSEFADANVQMRLVEVAREGTDMLPLDYDPDVIAAFWGKRPGAVTTRIFQLLSIAGGFLSGIAWDIVRGKVQENEVKRAVQLREIVTSLGPAYIKLGQALSIRPDLLSPKAMNELQKLCDKVPSYPNEIAMKLIEDELGAPWYEVYSELSPNPIAAASLGQVYKGRLKATGDNVAVKVQRPFVLETVTVDLFIIRKLGVALRKVPQIATDVVGLVDEWAARFFEELDYVREGRNATEFAAMIKDDLPQIVVPKTYAEYTSRRVLTSEWLEGEKLAQSKADDVADLVNIGVIAYLKQLLDTGFFHADPHPGNLIRTPDGRLAILDFGLMTRITDDQKYGMIEAISHLMHRDYEAIVEDFVLLDFIPPGVNLQPIMPVLAKVFDQALAGGGAKSINFQELAADLAQITFDYPFRIPPYFALIIRAIGVLEGIALVGNPDFAIVDEAYPYISKRLLTDQSPRLRAALRYTIYGKSNVLNVDRLIDVLQAFETFTVASQSAQGNSTYGNDEFNRGQLVSTPASTSATYTSESFATRFFAPGDDMNRNREALNFLLSPEGSFFREFLLDEIVKGIDAMSRQQLLELVSTLGLQNTYVPVLVPGAVRGFKLAPDLSVDDRQVVDNVVKMFTFLAGGSSSAGAVGSGPLGAFPSPVSLFLPGEQSAAFRQLAPLLPAVAMEILPEVINRLTGRIVARFIREVFVR
eukprot:jgi/Chlat1/4913/Chrsp31S04834